MKITIGTPHNGDFTPEYVASLFTLTQGKEHNYQLALFETCLVHQGRNEIAHSAEGDFLLFIDTDMAFPKSALNKLLSLKKDIVAGLCYSRKAPHLPNAHMLVDGLYKNVLDIPDEPFECDAMGTGFMLISRKVLDAFKGEKPFGFETVNGKELGEDITFCRRAKEKGFEIWCDPTIQIIHMGKNAISRNHFEAYKIHRQA